MTSLNIPEEYKGAGIIHVSMGKVIRGISYFPLYRKNETDLKEDIKGSKLEVFCDIKNVDVSIMEHVREYFEVQTKAGMDSPISKDTFYDWLNEKLNLEQGAN